MMNERQTRVLTQRYEQSLDGSTAISVSGVHKSFGPVKALDGVELEVARGSILALLGPNGAGKTTLVRILTTLLAPDAGMVRVASHNVVAEPHAVRAAIGLAGQSAAVDEILTGRENLELVGRLYHLRRAEARGRASELLALFGLTDAADRMAKTYSGGMRRRLDLAASLVGRPRILFLDEPTTGLDPQSRIGLWRAIQDLVRDGMTVFLTTQYMDEADYLAHGIAVIDRGRIIARGSADELKTQMGGDVLAMHVVDRGAASAAAEVVRGFGSGEAHVDEEAGRVVLPVSRGVEALVEVVRGLDSAKIELADINLRRPTLDEVFLSLTGQVPDAGEEQGNGAGAGHRRRGGAW